MLAAVARTRTVFRCGECGSASPQWVGRCPGCQAWNTLTEEAQAPTRPPSRLFGGQGPDPLRERAMPVTEVDADGHDRRPTGISEFDRVLGGGLVAGSVTLLGGEPGIGKSTLALQVAASLARGRSRALVVSGEESVQQVRLRAERLGASVEALWLLAETDMEAIAAAVDDVNPLCLIVDSIQTVADPDVASAAGSVTQVRECASAITALARRLAMSAILVGHVTKDGDLAGPRVLEHLVDTVLSFEGDRHHSLRLLRARKNRYGATTELGLFEMVSEGLQGVPDAGALFLADRQPGVGGSVVVPTLDGHRPLLVEVQGLVAPTALPLPRRSAQGIDAGRLSMIIAVLHRRAAINLATLDVYALAAGGVKVGEPAADLGVAVALASSHLDRSVDPNLVICGELGLGGELRQVSQMDRRLHEAARLGFTRALVPESSGPMPAGIVALRAKSLAEALQLVGLAGASRATD